VEAVRKDMPTGNAVVDRAIEAHGGESTWRAVQTVATNWTFRGAMFKLRLRESQLKGMEPERLAFFINTYLSEMASIALESSIGMAMSPGPPRRRSYRRGWISPGASSSWSSKISIVGLRRLCLPRLGATGERPSTKNHRLS